MGKMRTILYAEDDQVLLTVYRKHLKQAGYLVVPAHDGLETLKHLSQFEPDLLILDLMMPKFDGEELLEFICKTPRLAKVSVIILSSKGVVDAEHEHLMKRADKYLVKQDCTPALLLAAVDKLFSEQFQDKPAGTDVTPDQFASSLLRAGLKRFSLG